MWPGFGENMRVLAWVVDRCEGKVEARETPIGFLPNPEDINTDGIDVSMETMQELLSVDLAKWEQEASDINKYFAEFGERMPETMLNELSKAA